METPRSLAAKWPLPFVLKTLNRSRDLRNKRRQRRRCFHFGSGWRKGRIFPLLFSRAKVSLSLFGARAGVTGKRKSSPASPREVVVVVVARLEANLFRRPRARTHTRTHTYKQANERERGGGITHGGANYWQLAIFRRRRTSGRFLTLALFFSGGTFAQNSREQEDEEDEEVEDEEKWGTRCLVGHFRDWQSPVEPISKKENPTNSLSYLGRPLLGPFPCISFG